MPHPPGCRVAIRKDGVFTKARPATTALKDIMQPIVPLFSTLTGIRVIYFENFFPWAVTPVGLARPQKERVGFWSFSLLCLLDGIAGEKQGIINNAALRFFIRRRAAARQPGVCRAGTRARHSAGEGGDTMNRISNGLLAGMAVGMVAGGAYLAATSKRHGSAKKAMKKNAAKAIKTIGGLVEEVSCMLK